MAVLAGLGALLLIYLDYEGVISVDYDKLSQMIQNLMGAASQSSTALTPIIVQLSFTGSFIVGIAVGVRLG